MCFIFLDLLNVYECFGHMCTCVPCVCWCPQRSGEGIRFPGTGVMDGCGLPCRCWDSNLGPLQEQHCALHRSAISPAPMTIYFKLAELWIRITQVIFYRISTPASISCSVSSQTHARQCELVTGWFLVASGLSMGKNYVGISEFTFASWEHTRSTLGTECTRNMAVLLNALLT
jgi:hypothetical protein